MSALSMLGILLKLAAFFARRAERADIEKVVLAELENLHGKRIKAAADARDDVVSGRVPSGSADPYRRD